MTERETSAILGLKAELKNVRAKARGLIEENRRWRDVAQVLRKLAGLDEARFKTLLQAESLPAE